MKTTIGVFDSLPEAMEAKRLLEEDKFSKHQISVLESHEKLGQIVRYKFSGTLSWSGIIVCMTIGITLGALSGENMITIPFFNYFGDAGWLIGAIAGANVGLISGGFVTFLIMIIMNNYRVNVYKAHLLKGRFLLIVHGNRFQVQLAEKIIRKHGKQHSINQF